MVKGEIVRVAGPLVVAEGLTDAKMYDIVRVGEDRLMGEIIELRGGRASIQVYEETAGVGPGDSVWATGEPLSVELGPGLISSIYDGVQRPLASLMEVSGSFIGRGIDAPGLDRKKKWRFEPTVKKGDQVEIGDIIGTVKETSIIIHKIMVPGGIKGELVEIEPGDFTVDEKIALIKDEDGNKHKVTMMQKWPVRIGRKYAEKRNPDEPLITGQRVIDTFFPIAKGGTATVPGPFGSGKCVAGNTPVFLGDGRLLPIKEIFNTYKEKGRSFKDDHEAFTILDKPLGVFSYVDGRFVKGKAISVYKGKSDSLLRVKTRTGRSVELTPIHRLHKIDEDLNVREVEAQNLREGDFLASPRLEYTEDSICKYVSEYNRACTEVNQSHGSLKLQKASDTHLDNIFADQIVSIESLPGPHDIYDLEVEDYHNFIGGEVPMILHNTVIQHQLAKWANAEIIIFIGCGERGNEMTDVLIEFPELTDPYSGKPLMERTVMIANTSNMPVAAREASIYTGITIAEYFRDMGYNVALQADSTSRWAEALREISGRLEEMPGEEGYPAYLSSRLAAFYERAGSVEAVGKPERQGSVTVIGSVSPPGGDLSEPVVQATLRVVKVFWGLEDKLAYERHFPAINWLISYSLYVDRLEKWWDENVDEEFGVERREAMRLLQIESELREIVRLVGVEALSSEERIILETAKSIREDFLQQNAFNDLDTFTSPERQFRLLDLVITWYKQASVAVAKGMSIDEINMSPVREKISKAKMLTDEQMEEFNVIKDEIIESLTVEEEIIEA